MNRLVYDPTTKRVFLSAGGKLICYVAATKEFISNFAAKAPTVTSRTVDCPGDGKIVYAHNNSVISLDLTTGQAWPIAQAPANVENIAADSAGNIYISCGADIYRIALRR